MEINIINTLLNQERVTSTYADIYLDDNFCKNKLDSCDENETHNVIQDHVLLEDTDVEWVSPSDHLIGKVELIPPFTSKITRGQTHEGILGIGNEVLEKEYKQFLTKLNRLLRENDETWNHILLDEQKITTKKVKKIYRDIFQQKSKIMNEEVMNFYEKSLQDLEEHLQSEVQSLLSGVYANMINTLNLEIPPTLRKEKIKLENVLKSRYKKEVFKIITYYKLLLNNELYKNNKLINCALNERNEALQAFCRQIDAERVTTSMYIMSMERKKCKIKKMNLNSFQTSEVKEKLKKIKEKQEFIEVFKQNEKKVLDMNKQWEDKIKKILQLFLKFVSFSLKLLPEQSNFLIDFQKMVVIQLNEMQKQPNIQSNILIDENNLLNIFEFESPATYIKECDQEPFSLVGDLSDSIPPRYGSTETLPSDVDLPIIRVNRQYIYAKCHGFEDIKNILELQQCRCARQPSPANSQSITSPTKDAEPITCTSAERKSSTELFIMDDVGRFEECPARKCGYWLERNLFPFMPSYLDFNEKNFERVKAILGTPPSKDVTPKLIRAKTIANSEEPFSETKEKRRHAESQYSEQELAAPEIDCTCINEQKLLINKSTDIIKETQSEILTRALMKRKTSLRRMLDQYPNLHKIFTDESFDFQL